MFIIRIADLEVGIENKYEGVRRLCRDYIIESGSPVFTVSASEAGIADEIAASLISVTPAYAESICLYREICRRMPDYSAFLLHAAVVECDGYSYAFSAKSGVGKSTHVSLWLKRFGSRARIINGDKPIIRFYEGGAYVFGTPWCGKEGYNENVRSSLAALCFIERGSENRIRPAAGSEITSKLLGQILLPREEAEIVKLMPLVDLTVRQIPCWVLSCTISEEAVEVAHNAMSGRGNNLWK